MAYISSSCSKKNSIVDAIDEIYKQGIKSIELSGGTKHYPNLEKDLIHLKESKDIDFLLHNYFPPPPESFVLNLASLNDDIYEKSISHIKRAIDLSEKLGADKYGFHAGFYFDIPVNEIGKKLSKVLLNDKSTAEKRFIDAFKEIEYYNKGRVKLYIENNVINRSNYEKFGENPLMLTSSNSYNNLKEKIDFNLLLDIAHLFVSCSTLNLDFADELKRLAKETDYIHVSDNNGEKDNNERLRLNSTIENELTFEILKNKTITLEVYDNFSSILDSLNIIQKKINAG